MVCVPGPVFIAGLMHNHFLGGGPLVQFALLCYQPAYMQICLCCCSDLGGGEAACKKDCGSGCAAHAAAILQHKRLRWFVQNVAAMYTFQDPRGFGTLNLRAVLVDSAAVVEALGFAEICICRAL